MAAILPDDSLMTSACRRLWSIFYNKSRVTSLSGATIRIGSGRRGGEELLVECFTQKIYEFLFESLCRHRGTPGRFVQEWIRVNGAGRTDDLRECDCGHRSSLLVVMLRGIVKPAVVDYL